MMFKEGIELITVEVYKDELHQEKSRESKQLVYGDKKSIGQSEFFMAGQNGFKPSNMFMVKAIDYNNQTKLIHEGKKYVIYRTFLKGENVELYCEFKVGA